MVPGLSHNILKASGFAAVPTRGEEIVFKKLKGFACIARITDYSDPMLRKQDC